MNEASAGPIRILHVDDDRNFAELVAASLERADDRFSVETATSANEGLARLDEGDIDCVVSDHDMAGMNGLEFLDAVRDRHDALPFVLFTGKGSEAIASETITRGATDYIQKRSGSEQYDLLANRITNAVGRYRAGRRARDLERARRVLSDVDRALVRAETRDEIERHACEIISGADPYQFAWIGIHDTNSDTVVPRTAAGNDEGYLDVIEVSTDETTTGWGPTGRAIRDRDVATVQDIPSADDYEPWREAAIERGYYSSAAIPLLYDDTLYGVLNVYADRTHAFDEDERDVLRELGSDIAHAIYRAEQAASLREQHRRMEALHVATRRLMAAETEAEIAELATEVAANTLDFPISVVRLLDDEGKLVPLAVSDWLKRERDSPRPAYEVGQPTAGLAFERGETVVYDDVESLDDDIERTPGAGMYVPIGEYGVLTISATEPDAFDEADVNLAEILAANTEAALARVESEGRIEALHRATRRLMTADTEQEVAERTAEATRDILGFPFTVVRFREDDDRLVPAVTSEDRRELDGERPVYEVGQPPVGRAFERGETIVYEDVERIDDGIERAPGDSTYVPIGEYGVLTVSGTESGAFDDSDVNAAEILAANAEVALQRVERIRELERQNERLDEFASIVSHDVRNPLNLATGHLSLATEECDSEHLDAVDSALDRMSEIIDDTLTLAREGRTLGETDPLDLAALAEQCWQGLDHAGADLRVETSATIEADRERLRRALENLFQNSVEHGSTSSRPAADDSVEHGAHRVTVRVGMLDAENGFYVEDDGPGIPEDDRATVFEPGWTTGEGGTGFGLAIVKRFVEAHGWEIRVTDGEIGGARFEITGVQVP
ncbi:MAG: GAF domain-containing protein [Haloferacaceae archaeon]